MGNFDGLFAGAMVIFVSIGIIIGATIMWLVPIAWNWLRPIIHAATS